MLFDNCLGDLRELICEALQWAVKPGSEDAEVIVGLQLLDPEFRKPM